MGAGAGLSTAAGLAYDGKRFKTNFRDFESKYGFHDMYSGGFYQYKTLEEYWAYWSKYIYINRYEENLEQNDLYTKLFNLIKNKDYFVITTNVDHQFQKAGFDKKRLFYTQGDYGLFQCSTPCCNKTFNNEKAIKEMVKKQKDFKIPTELIPKCPVCHKPMAMNLRCDEKFVQDDEWYKAADRYNDFIRRHKNLHTLYLELGVGFNTPGIIKYPFWQMTAQNEKAVYACINKTEAISPNEIKNKSILIKTDLYNTISAMQ